nr:PREDICTED: uncharacterized protein LOC108204378 [Daucus carota subsp. sativus]
MICIECESGKMRLRYETEIGFKKSLEMNCLIEVASMAKAKRGVRVIEYPEDKWNVHGDCQESRPPDSRAVTLNGDRTGGRLNKKINMWMLDDDACLKGGGVEASWTIMFSIDLAMPAVLYNGYFSNGELLLLIRNHDDCMWISCDADKKEAKIARVEMADHHYTHRLARYTESMVSLPGFKQIKDWNGGDDDN